MEAGLNWEISAPDEALRLAPLILQALDIAMRHDLTCSEGEFANDRSLEGRIAVAMEVLKIALGGRSTVSTK